MEKSKVYFTKQISPEKSVEMFEKLGVDLGGNVAVKVHTGEKGNQNYLRPDFLKPVVERVDGTVVECNTAYEGERNDSEKHKKLLKEHGWSDAFKVELLDEEGPDLALEVKDGKVLKENLVGKGIEDYDSVLVFSHFKGHPMGGFGGALKQLSIGFASSAGKANIHSGGACLDQEILWDHTADQDDFLTAMAEAAKTVTDRFGDNIAYINVIKNLSVDCDCCEVAEDPCMEDIGIMASTDPVALDQACLDLIYNSDDPGRDHLIERIESRNGALILEAAQDIGIGSRDYEIVEVE